MRPGLILRNITQDLVLVARRAAPLPAPLAVWPVGVLLGYIALSACVSFVLHDPAITFIGLRSFMFLGIAVLGLWLVPHLPIIAACVATLLVVEAALIPWELLRSVHLHGHFYALPFTGRVSGTLVLPNTLGTFAVVALAFYYAFASTRRWLKPLSVLAFCLVAVSGSATGVICVGVILLVAVIDLAAPNKRRFLVICGVLCITILVALMPMLTGRPKVFDSFFAPGARLDGIYTALTGREPLATMFGSGLGLGSNATTSALHAPATAALLSPSARAYLGSAESTVATLLTQIGVLGTLLFYAVIGWAAFRDQRARMFYIVVMICSLTLKITELFPVNFLLGVALAHSVSLGATKRE